MILSMHMNKNNHATRVIDVFFVPRACRGEACQSEVWSRDKKVCARLRKSAVKEKIISFRLIISKKREKNPIIN
jgi:hypothetical protein